MGGFRKGRAGVWEFQRLSCILVFKEWKQQNNENTSTALNSILRQFRQNHSWVKPLHFCRIYMNLSSQHCAHGLLRLRHKSHLVRLRKASWLGLKYLLWLPRSQMETVWFLMKNSWFWPPQKLLEMPPRLVTTTPGFKIKSPPPHMCGIWLISK